MSKKEYAATVIIKSESLQAKELYQRIGVSQALVFEKGAPISARPGAHVYPHTMWKLQSVLPDSSAVAEHIEHLLEILEPNAVAIRNLSLECSKELWIVIAFEDSQLGFALEPEQLGRIAQLGIASVFDIYSLPASH